jgi:hypothetical protein
VRGGGDTILARLDLDFGVKFYDVQFYAIEHNFQLYLWIEMKFNQEFSDIFFHFEFKFQVN